MPSFYAQPMKITVRAAVEEDPAALLDLYGELTPDDARGEAQGVG
jgi:hypothetical protein